MTKQELAAKIWATANALRKNIKASEYKDYILGFMFYKYLCDKETDYLKGLGGSIEDIKDAGEAVKNKFKDGIGYFISYDNLFIVWKEKGVSLGAKDVSEALDSFYMNLNGRYKTVFDKVFSALQSGLTKLGENSGSRDKAVRDIVDLVDIIPPTSKNYDVLGYIYEYLIQQFSSEAKKDGAFYTPHEITSLMARIIAERLKDREEITVYDPTVGTGGLLLNIGKEAKKYISPNKIKYYGQELITETSNLAKMNLFMQGVPVQNINMRNANTLEEDWPYFDEYTAYAPLFVDATVSNPPYSAHYEPEEHITDERFKGYGLAPSGKADYAFLLHCLYHIKNDGIMAIVLPHGVLFRGDSEGEIRKNLILNHNIETIIGMPGNMFFATGIPVIVMILSKNRKSDDILFIDASKSYKKDSKQNVLRESDVQRIFDAVIERKDIPNFARLVSLEEIRSNDYNLNIPRYVSAAEDEEGYDLYSVMTGLVSEKELDAFANIWKEFPKLKEKLFDSEDGYYSFAEANKEVVFNDEDVKKYLDTFKKTTEGFEESLKKTLIEGKTNPSVKETIKDRLFETYNNIPLIDVYQVYQAFVDNWTGTDEDLARIEDEGWSICAEIEPNMITKKDSKTKTTVEEQKGWKGKILPFDMIKKEFFADDYEEMKKFSDKAESYKAEYIQIWEDLEEDTKSLIAKENDEENFDEKKIAKVLKEHVSDEIKNNLQKIRDLIAAEKNLNKEVKVIESGLDNKAKEKILELSEDEVKDLLFKKWIVPVTENINGIAKAVFVSFSAQIESLRKKYENPLSSLSEEIEDTSNFLKESMNHLVGSSIDMKAIKLLMEEI